MAGDDGFLLSDLSVFYFYFSRMHVKSCILLSLLNATRNMATLTNTLIDFHLSYKRTTKIALDWLSTQTCSVGNWESKGTFGSTREIIDCVKRLPDRYEVPIFVITALREAIEARRRVHQMYKELHASASVAFAQDSDDAHEAFIAR